MNPCLKCPCFFRNFWKDNDILVVDNLSTGERNVPPQKPQTVEGFFWILRRQFQRYDRVITTDSQESMLFDANSTSPSKKKGVTTIKIDGSSPLRVATKFHYNDTKNIPTIDNDEVVMPGSELQRQMSWRMNSSRFVPLQGDECVICLEPFEPTNPRMPTICACGQDKAFFHLPCLYQWVEHCPDCPACRQPLTWEEFS